MAAQLVAGQCFESRAALKAAVYSHAKEVNLYVRTAVSRSKEVEFRCKVDPSCAFKIRGLPSRIPNDSAWRLAKTVNLQHSCDPMAHISSSIPISAVEVSGLLVDRLRQEGTVPTGQGIVDKAATDLKASISTSTAYKASKLAKQAVYGSKEDEYNLLNPYFEELKRTNPGTIAEVFFHPTTNQFVRCYVIPSYGKTFLRHALPVIFQDMAHLKTKVPGTLWLVVGMDGDHHLMVVGWGLCSPENKEEWKIFQQGLCQQYSMELVEQIFFFLSDRQKGSVESFAQVFGPLGLKLHHDINHVENNLLAQFKCGDTLRSLFQQAVNCFTTQEKSQHMQAIANLQPAAAEYLNAIEPSILFRASADRPKFGVLTNMAETMNGVFAKARGTTRLNLLKKIEHWVVEHMAKGKIDSQALLDAPRELCEYASNQIGTSVPYLASYKYSPTNVDQVYVVYTDHLNQWQINLANKTCTCKRYDELQLPCVHARGYYS